MKVKLRIISVSLVLFLFLCFYPKPLIAFEALEVTPSIPEQPSVEGELFYSSILNVDYVGQKVFLSGDDNGLEEITLNDTLDVIVYNSDGVKTRFIDVFGGCNGHENKEAVNMTSLFTALGNAQVEVNLRNCGLTASSGAMYLILDEQDEQILDTGFVSPTGYQIVRGNWQNPENAFNDDSDFASVGSVISGERAIRYLGYNFDIPTEAEIKGIVARIDIATGGWGGLNNIYQGDTRGNHGVALGDDHIRIGSKSAFISGSPDELWGLSWTNESVNTLKIEYGAAPRNLGHSLYWVAAKVYYTLPEPAEVVLDVPSFKQTDPAWDDDIYDNALNNSPRCGETMADCACALTSATMVMKYFGVNRTPNADEINPQTINDYFKINSVGFDSANFRWGYLGNFSSDANKALFGGQPKLKQPVRANYDLDLAKILIDNNKPIILRVNNGSHWVVVKGYDRDTNRLIINDPVRPDPPLGKYTYLDEFYTPDLLGSMILYETTNSDYRYLEFATNSNNHLLVEDMEGNKTGFNPETGQIIKEITNSDYALDPYYVSPLAEGVSPTTEGVYFLTLKLPEDGSFKLKIISQDGNTHPVHVYSSDIEGNLAGEIINPEDAEESYTFVYTEETAGDEVNMSKDQEEIEVNIEVGPLIKSNVIIPHRWFPVPVAILASDTFDVKKVDTDSLTFGKTGAEDSLIGCARIMVDTNRDRKKDLICYFSAEKLGLDTSDKEVILRGVYDESLQFEGKDNVNVIKPWFLF